MRCEECDDFGDAMDDPVCRVCYQKALRTIDELRALIGRLEAILKGGPKL